MDDGDVDSALTVGVMTTVVSIVVGVPSMVTMRFVVRKLVLNSGFGIGVSSGCFVVDVDFSSGLADALSVSEPL